jgi:hypothetical protein
MQFTALSLAAFTTFAAASAIEKRVDIPGLKCGGLDAISVCFPFTSAPI